MFNKEQNQNNCEHLLVDLCKGLECSRPNNHMYCRRCGRNIDLPEVHYSGLRNEISSDG